MRFKVLSVAAALMALPVAPVAAQEEGAAAAEITGDAAAGESVFRRCQACHMVGPDAQNRVGPVLNGVVGREAAAVEDFDYSDAMIEAAEEGLVWTVADLDEYLEAPRDKVPGTKMVFPGLRDADQRADVIAYIHENSE